MVVCQNKSNSVRYVCQQAGFVDGSEYVYDFKHQERGFFTYSGTVFTPDSIGGYNRSTYIGETRGFANVSPLGLRRSYEVGVDAYGGFSQGTTVTSGLDQLGFLKTDGTPLDRNKQINSNGVYATYYGWNYGLGVSPPFGGDIAVAKYTREEREQYLRVLGQLQGRDAIFQAKTDINNRRRIAVEMEKDIRSRFESYFFNIPPFTTLRDQALVILWDFVDEPGIYLPVIQK